MFHKGADTVGELLDGLKLLLKLACLQERSGMSCESVGQFANSIGAFKIHKIDGVDKPIEKCSSASQRAFA